VTDDTRFMSSDLLARVDSEMQEILES
jgi:hypothetical protein